MSLKITGLVDNPLLVLEDQSKSAVITDSELINFFQQKIAPLCDPTNSYEDAIKTIHKADIPFKYQLMTLGVQAYIAEKFPLKTTEKIVKLLAENGYLYHASLLASLQDDYSSILEPICLPVFTKLEKYKKCEEELKGLKNNIRSIDQSIETIAKHHFNEALAFLPLVSSSSSKNLCLEVAVKKLSNAGRVDEARSIVSQLPNASHFKIRASLAIIEALAKLGDIQGALKSIPEIGAGINSDKARVSIIAVLAKCDRIEEAIAIFETIETLSSREQAALFLIMALIQDGKSDLRKLNMALELLRRVSYFPNLIALNRGVEVAVVTSIDVKRDLIIELLNASRFEDAMSIFIAGSEDNEQALLGLPIIQGFLDTDRVEEAQTMIADFACNSLFQDKGNVAIIKHNLKPFMLKISEIKLLVDEFAALSIEIENAAKVTPSNAVIVEENKKVQERASFIQNEIRRETKPLEDSMMLFFEIKDIDQRSFALAAIMDGYLKVGCTQILGSILSQIKDVNSKILYPLLRKYIMILMDNENFDEALSVLSKASDNELTMAMLALPIFKILLKNKENDKALELLDELSSSERCLNPVKLTLAENLIRKNRRITQIEQQILLDHNQAGVVSFLPVIRALKDVGKINEAISYLKKHLVSTLNQDPLSEITIEILKDLVNQKADREISFINSIITDETLQEKIVKAFINLSNVDRAIGFLKCYLRKNKEQIHFSEVLIEIIGELFRANNFIEFGDVESLITDENLKNKILPNVNRVKILEEVRYLASSYITQAVKRAHLKVHEVCIDAESNKELLLNSKV